MKTPPLTIRTSALVSKPTSPSASNDRVLALALAVLLLKNNADLELIAALLYLAL